jgi:hypothetical protein
VLRRSLTALTAVVLTAVASGCTTFSDSDAVARVDDVSLSSEDFEAQLTELGADTSQVVPADPVRAELTRWIREQLVDPEAAGAVYDAGSRESGAVCIDAIVVEDEGLSEQLLADLEGGADFGELFAANNIDPSIAETEGRVDCIVGDQLNAATDTPFVQEAIFLTADDPLSSAPILDLEGATVAWVVMRFRPFDELTPEDIAAVAGVIPVDTTGADVFVDPRYGTFDRETGQVVAVD